MVENSLGRLWLEGHPNTELENKWKYYVKDAEQEADVESQLINIKNESKILRPEDIKVIDPCMGSGHILVYIFDVLMDIYELPDELVSFQSLDMNKLGFIQDLVRGIDKIFNRKTIKIS